MADHSKMKLGRKAIKTDSRTLALGRYLTPGLPPPPPACDWTKGITDWGMMLNGPEPSEPEFPEGLGDCTIAGCGHAVQVWSANTGSMVTVPDATILNYYEQWDGYVPDDPSTDAGGIELDVLNDWQKQSFAGNALLAFADPKPANLTDVRQSIALFGGVYIGLSLPLTAQTQDVWDVVPRGGANAKPGSWGGHCLAPGTRVLTGDLRWVPIETLHPGDILFGFDEFRIPREKSRRFRNSIVEATETIQLPCYDLRFDDGTKVRCSFDHQWLVKNSDEVQHWVSTEELRSGARRSSSVYKPLSVWKEDLSRDAGYLAGVFDGEGWIDGEKKRAIHKAGFAQADNELLRHATAALTERGIVFKKRVARTGYPKKPVTQVVIQTSKANLARFLGGIRPHRLLSGFNADRFGNLECGNTVKVLEKKSCGVQEVIAVQTSTRTFIAEGMASHNCVFVPKYDQKGFTCITWGQLKTMTVAFWNKYCDEAHALLAQDWLTAKGAPSGFDQAQLQADLNAIV
jgi:hypothetical protein